MAPNPKNHEDRPENRGQERDRRTAEDVQRSEKRSNEDEERQDKRYLEDMIETDSERQKILGIPARPSLAHRVAAGVTQGLIIAVIVIGLAFGVNAWIGPSPLEERVDQNTQEIKNLVREELAELKRLNRQQRRAGEDIAVGTGVLICLELFPEPTNVDQLVFCTGRVLEALENRTLVQALREFARTGELNDRDGNKGKGSKGSQPSDGSGDGTSPGGERRKNGPRPKRPRPSPSPSPSPDPQICVGPICIPDPRPNSQE